MKRVFIMAHKTARENAIQAVQSAPDGFSVTISEPNRTLEQNAAQWPILEAFADQLQWPVNGQMVWMTPEEWKDVLTAAFKRETARIAMGLDGGVVMLGMRTSKMGKKQFSEWIDFIKATAALRDVDIDYMDHA
jgi:hypothetical protein